jgi:hypothetical protein
MSKIVSLFVARLYVFISIWRGFEEDGSHQEKKMVGTLVLDPLLKRMSALPLVRFIP